jgi:rod shape-determining protein MreC
VAEPRGPRSRSPLGGRSNRSPGPRSDRNSSSLVLFVLISATIIVIGSSSPLAGVRGRIHDLFAPARSVGDTVAKPGSNLWDSVRSRTRLEDENAKLRQELADAQTKVALAEDALRERRELFALNDVEEVTGIPAVSARVTQSSFDSFTVTIELTRGENDGVKVGMPVVSGYGLVGVVTAVTPRAARVRLLTDRESVIGVRHARTGDSGFAIGSGRSKALSVQVIEPTTPVRAGDTFVTAGLINAAYPAGLAVGTVLSAQWEQGQLQQTVTLNPMIDLDRLSLVKVLLWTPPPLVPADIVTTLPPASSTTSVVSGDSSNPSDSGSVGDELTTTIGNVTTVALTTGALTDFEER